MHMTTPPARPALHSLMHTAAFAHMTTRSVMHTTTHSVMNTTMHLATHPLATHLAIHTLTRS